MTTPSDHAERAYVLGTHDAELDRLGFQHRLWSDVAVAHWKRAGFSRDHTILDVGCGPGFGSRDLAQLVGPEGRIIAIDESRRYVDFINHRGSPPGGAPIEARLGDVQSLDLPERSIDGAYARWVLCFTPEPEPVVAGVARALRPGACFAVQDYSNWMGLHWGPHNDTLPTIRRAIIAAYGDARADWAVGQRIPAFMTRNNLDIAEVRALARCARPHDLLWQWPETFFRLFLPRLVESGHLTTDELRAWETEWAALSADPAAMFFTPPQVEIIARKR